MLEPLDKKDDGIIIEFKVFDPEDENTLNDTVASALAQIEEKGADRIKREVVYEKVYKKINLFITCLRDCYRNGEHVRAGGNA
jgi:hypothetical protein